MTDAEEIEIDEDDFEEELNSIYGDVEVCGMKYPAGRVLREVDPIAFRCALSDKPSLYECGNCGERYEDKDEAEECCKEE